jgi:uncharacterized surface protein with fasciclin (FAS1) repeats
MSVLSRGILASAFVLILISATACGQSSSSPQGAASGGPGPVPTLDEDTGSTLPIDATGPACPARGSGTGGFGVLQDMSNQPMAAAVAENPDLSIFSGLLKQNGADTYLDYSLSAATLFAPDNAAFQNLRKQLGPQRYDDLSTNKENFTKFVKSLTVLQFDSRRVLAQAGSVRTLAGTDLRVRHSGATVSIQNPTGQTADIVCGDIPTQNALVQIVNNVPVPSGQIAG